MIFLMLLLLYMNKKTQNLQPDTISSILLYCEMATAPKCPNTATAHAARQRVPSLRLPLCRALKSRAIFAVQIHIIMLQTLITKMPRMKGTQKLVIAGLGLAFLAIIVSSLSKELDFAAGIIFVGIVILGVVGLIKMRRRP